MSDQNDPTFAALLETALPSGVICETVDLELRPSDAFVEVDAHFWRVDEVHLSDGALDAVIRGCLSELEIPSEWRVSVGVDLEVADDDSPSEILDQLAESLGFSDGDEYRLRLFARSLATEIRSGDETGWLDHGGGSEASDHASSGLWDVDELRAAVEEELGSGIEEALLEAPLAEVARALSAGCSPDVNHREVARWLGVPMDGGVEGAGRAVEPEAGEVGREFFLDGVDLPDGTTATLLVRFEPDAMGFFGDAIGPTDFWFVRDDAAALRIVERIRRDRKGVEVTVSWAHGACRPTARVAPADWAKVCAGEEVVAFADYWYEGASFEACFSFNESGPGTLRVSYDGGGDGFVGWIEDADIFGGTYSGQRGPSA